MPTDVPTWEETTDVPAWDETKALAAPPATPRFDTSKVQLNPYQDYYAKTGLTDPTREGFGSWMSRQPPEKPSIGPAKEIGALTGWDRLKYTVQNKLESVFPGMAEKGSPAPGEVIGQTAMLLPLGMPERLGKLVLGYFAARTLEAQPEYYRQIKNELQSGDYSAAQRNAIEDVLNIGMVTGGAMSFGGKPPTGELQGPPATGAVLQRPPGAVPPPTTGPTEFGQIPGVPTRGIPAPPMPDPRLVRARPVVPGTPAEPRETSIQTIQRTQAKTVSQIQQLFPKAGLSREQARVLRNVAWGIPEPTTPTTYAETIRGNQRQLRTPGQVAEGGEAPGRHDLEQAAPGQPEPVDTREETEGKVPLTPEPEPGTVRLYRGQPGAGGSGSFWSTDPNYARSFGENVQFVDVPKDVADSARAAFQKTGSGTPGAHILPDEWQKKAQPMERPPEQKVYDLEEPPAEPEKPTVPAPKDNWQVVVQTFPGKIPGFVQIIDPAQTERSKSPTIESLRAAGHEVPDFSKLPTGRYTFAQAKKLLASQGTAPPAGKTEAGEPEQFNLLEVPRAKPAEAQIIQLRRMLETADRLYGQGEGYEKWIADRLNVLERTKLSAAARPAVQKTPAQIPTKPTAPTPPVTAPAESDKPALPESPIPAAGEPIQTYTAGNVETTAGVPGRTTYKAQKQFLLDAVTQAIKEYKPAKLTPAQVKLIAEGRDLSREFDRQNRDKYYRPSPETKDNPLVKRSNEWTARMKAQLPYVVFDVPGDGVFSVLQTADALGQFRDMVKKEFPVGKGGFSKPGKVRTGEATAPALVENPDIKGIIKALGTHTSSDETRLHLTAIFSNGKEMVATDGRRMIRVLGKVPGTEANPVQIDPETGKTEPWNEKMHGVFPEYRQVEVPNENRVFMGTADTEDLWRNVLRAELMTSEKATSVKLYRNPDGTFGTASHSPDVGESAHNIQKGAVVVGAYNPAYLREALQSARHLGNASVDLYAADSFTPLVIRGKNHEEHLMPMRLNGGSEDKPAPAAKSAPLFSEPLPPAMETKWWGPKEAERIAAAKLDIADFEKALKTEARPERREILRQKIKDLKATLKQAKKPAVPPTPETPPTAEPGETHIAGFGASVRQAGAVPVANTPQQLTKLRNSMTPGLAAGKAGVQSLLLPTAKSPEHLHTAEILGAKLGAVNHRTEATAHALRGAEKFFDRQGVHNEKLTPDKNPGIRFMSNMSQGRVFVGRHKAIADQIQKMFKDRLGKLAQAGAPLQTVRKNYFSGMWTRESRLAFNAAMEQAVQQGVIPKDADVNTATPAQKAWVKARVDQFLEQGVGSDTDMLAYFTKRPLKGRESFRKKKVFDDIMTAAEFGLRPVSNNPIDLVKGKLAEMDKSIMANEFFRQLKDENSLEIISPYEDVPDGWVKLNDKYGTIYGAPTVNIPEFIDKNIYEGLLDFAGKLGIKHQRSMKFPPGPGSRALGLSYQGQNFVRTRFATETSVLAHEIGHQLDHRYDLWNRIVSEAVGIGKKGVQTKGASQKMRGTIQKELRAIADLTGSRGGDPHKKEEKIAQMVEAYVHAEEMMQEAAPTVFKAFEKFIESKPELKGLADLKPGIELENLTSEKYVGLPIMGYRIVPKATGDIVNNYLSSSIYNNKYFGGLYRAWMNTANSLNQTQLGMGSAFHAGFTTADVQVSAGALALKDIYGIVRGNRSPGDLANTLKKWTTASVQTAMTGDKVLNAWRNPDGVIDPRIAQVVKATELAGGGYRLEHGLRTYQTAQMERDWYSGHRLRAAARSPIALTELMLKPIMDILVPRQKAGVFAELAWRIIEQNPGKQLEELTPQFRQAWNRVDARLGQVRYNRLFMNNTAKNIAQGLVRAPGWTGGTIAELGGAFPDAANFFKEWKTTGRMPDNIPDRVAYTLSLLATVGTVNAALTYAFTGQAPHGMDFFAFRTGRKDKDGNDERFLLPTYVKDLLAYAKQPKITLGHKSHPLLSVLYDVANNRDYYGYEIRDPNAPATSQAGQVAKYVISSYEPFWTRGARQTWKTGKGTARLAAPYFGTMPAPAYIVRSSIQNQISHLYHLRTGERTKPYEAREADAEKRAARDTSAMDVYMFKRLPKSDQAALARKMSPEEKARYGVAVSESTPRPAWAMQAPPQ